jgi:hypothetical protein
LVLLGLLATNVSAQQHLVLFETFTNSYDLCPQGNVFDQEFKQTLSSEGSKVIHLNHHIGNIGDPMAQSGGAAGSNQTAFALSGGNYVFMSAVNRTDFGGTTGRTTTSQTDWESRIGSEWSKTPATSISLVNATYDKSLNVLHALVRVTALKTLSNAVMVHYAITQDNVSWAQCNGTGPSTHNNVVRIVTVGDSVGLPSGTSSGTSVTVEYNQTIRATGQGMDIKQMKLIAFTTNSNGTVDNAAILKKNFDTLQAPPQALAFVDSSIDNRVYHPGDIAVIDYTSSNVLYVDAYYSLDNGSTWHGFTTSGASPINWTVPDSATTQGKFKLIGPDGTPIAIQTGTFSIVPKARSLTLLHPTVGDTARMLLKFLIQWSKVGFDAVKLEYTDDGGAHYTLIAPSVTDTFYNWTVPNVKTNQAQIRITPLGVSDVPSVTSPQFTITGGVGAVRTDDLRPLELLSTYPNPATSGSSVMLSIHASNSTLLVQVLDLLGNEVLHISGYPNADGSFRLPTEHLSAGSYIVRVTDGITSDSKRIVVE